MMILTVTNNKRYKAKDGVKPVMTCFTYSRGRK